MSKLKGTITAKQHAAILKYQEKLAKDFYKNYAILEKVFPNLDTNKELCYELIAKQENE